MHPFDEKSSNNIRMWKYAAAELKQGTGVAQAV
jgi:hypothetical protein